MILAAGVVGIIGMMVFPMPTAVLDVLLVISMAIAVSMLMVSIYVGDVRRLAAFPTIILITTLFRLALGVAATRLILLDADAGSVIHSFGAFVVRGNFTVGLVVFLLLTVTQFLAIAKGSDRVADAATHFVFETLPSKALSIERDLRVGAFDLDVARAQRDALNKESQMLGSMDGAMKFVKGDSIAGLIIVAINIIAGIIIGVMMLDFTAEAAIEHYCTLAIGVGLVSQSPALLNSMAAGLIVTRLTHEQQTDTTQHEEQKHRLSSFITQYGLLLWLAALSIAPTGLPLLPFLLMSAVVLGLAYGLWRTSRRYAED